MGNTQTIIIAENNDAERHNLKRHLEKESFIVFEASMAKRLIAVIENHHVDLIVLNCRLPDGLALDYLKTIRDYTNAPLLLTGGHAETGQRIASLNLGADDFILKPYDISELTARIHASLRRYNSENQNQKPTPETFCHADVIAFKNWIMDRNRMQVTDGRGINSGINPAEFKLLDILAQSHGHVVTRYDICKALSDFTHKKISNTCLNVKITRLRQKLNDCARDPEIIKTVRDVGYFFDCDVKPHP